VTNPHKINVEDIPKHIGWHEVAAATTADGTQRKRLLVAIGEDRWAVARYYIADPEWGLEMVYGGEDKAEAVRIYNGLG